MDILKKAKEKLLKQIKEKQYIDICLEAMLCPVCGSDMHKIIESHFWSLDCVVVKCTIDSSHYYKIEHDIPLMVI